MSTLRIGGLPVLALAIFLTAGCQKPPGQAKGEPPPPEVKVGVPVSMTVTDYEVFPGRTEARFSVDLRARVTGYLDKVLFHEGDLVEIDQPLFEIDPRTYQAELARTEAALVQAEARMGRLERDLSRANQMFAKNAIGREELDRVGGDRQEAVAAVGVARAARDLAKLNVGFCKVRSPIKGRVSRRYIDPGNLVKADDTVLTSVVSLDKMYAYFDLDERTTLRLQELMRHGKLNLSREARLPVWMELASEHDFPREGVIDFADNRVDADTGTWRLRGLFDNPSKNGLSSGLFVRVKLNIGDPYPALLVAEQALGSDQGQRFVYVVSQDNTVDYRRVEVGRMFNGLRVINKFDEKTGSGVAPGEKVIVSGLQRVRQGSKVVPLDVDMRTIGTDAAEAEGPIKKPSKK